MKKNQGMTLIGMLLSAATVAMALIIVMRVIPVYLKHYTVVQAVNSLSSTPSSSITGDVSTDISLLQSSLDRRFNMESINDIKENQIVITPEGHNKYLIKLNYQEIRPLIYNISLMFDFNDEIEVVIGSEN